MTSVIHHSIFLKADTRIAASRGGCRIYTAVAGDNVIVRDVFLSAATDADVCFSDNGEVIIIPVVGTLVLRQSKDEQHTLSPGGILRFDNSTEKFTAKNLHTDETINFLYITFTHQAIASAQSPSVAALDITDKNCLISGDGFAQHIRLGVYDGRVDDFATVSPDKKLLSYIINGSFEVDGRLMEYRDGLVLWDREEVEFEALSEAAIILLIEFST